MEYQDGSVTRLGIVRATQVEAGMPEVWQTLGIWKAGRVCLMNDMELDIGAGVDNSYHDLDEADA